MSFICSIFFHGVPASLRFLCHTSVIIFLGLSQMKEKSNASKPASVKNKATALTRYFLLQHMAYSGCEKSCLKLLHRVGVVQLRRSSSILPWTSLHPSRWRSGARGKTLLVYRSRTSDQQTHPWYGTGAPHLPLPKGIKTPPFAYPDCAPTFGRRCFSQGEWLGTPWSVLAHTDVAPEYRPSCSRPASCRAWRHRCCPREVPERSGMETKLRRWLCSWYHT